MVLLQLSASQGPDECALAVARALRALLREAEAAGVEVDIVEQQDGPRAGTLRSALLALDGERAIELAQAWSGTLQWICSSPYRPRHARKNWFIGARIVAGEEELADSGIRYETCKASGPGGQHVNKTESAVRATHLASGISVKVQSERSQHANRRLAALLLASRLAERAEEARGEQRAERRLFHHAVERGNAVRVFRGEAFERVR